MTDVRSSIVGVAERIREQRDALDSRRAVQLRAVEPLLEALGWDVRSTDVDPDASVGGLAVDYLLAVDGRPEVAVLTAAPDGDAAGDGERALAAGLASADVDWGLVTDGWHLSLLAGDDGDVHRRRLDVADLADEPSSLDAYARTAAAERAADREETTTARRRLAEHREEAVVAVADAVCSVAGDELRDRARDAAERLVHDLAADPESTAGEPPSERSPSGESAPEQSPSGGSTGERPGADAPPDDHEVPASHDGDSPECGDGPADDGQAGDGSDATRDLPASDEGEYVVRFFGGRSSVGAVGTDTPAGTLVGAVKFLRDSHGLEGSVELPWGVEDGRATVAPVPEHPDGTAMSYYRELDGGWYVWTGGGERWARAAIEGLADAVGLRVMYQGDW